MNSHRSSRRSVVAALGTIASGAGCLTRTISEQPAKSESSDTTSTPSLADASSTTAVRCRGDPVPLTRSISDEPGYDDDINYFSSNETVRFVKARSGDAPAAFGTMTFTEWGTIQATKSGLERVREVTADRLEGEAFASSMGQPPEAASEYTVVVWVRPTGQTGAGTPTRSEAVSLAELADAAPRTVNATITLDGDGFSKRVPVFAGRPRSDDPPTESLTQPTQDA